MRCAGVRLRGIVKTTDCGGNTVLSGVCVKCGKPAAMKEGNVYMVDSGRVVGRRSNEKKKKCCVIVDFVSNAEWYH